MPAFYAPQQTALNPPIYKPYPLMASTNYPFMSAAPNLHNLDSRLQGSGFNVENNNFGNFLNSTKYGCNENGSPRDHQQHGFEGTARLTGLSSPPFLTNQLAECHVMGSNQERRKNGDRTTPSEVNNSDCSNTCNDDGSSISSSTVTTGNFGTPNKDLFDERVQVDRRKLENMITATRDQIINGRSDILTTAEEFFSQIMTRTSTQITWPSRLKIGAKTKKDPYVKVLGRYCDVQMAKEMILSVLKTRQSRVTLKIDVAFTDHSHIIGKQGRNTQQVMKETGCHIHFPDSNRNPDMEKSNMVSIAGPLQSVEKARRAIRNLAPLVITFEMKDLNGNVNVVELNDDPVVQDAATRFCVGVAIRPNRSSGQPYCVVKGSAYQERSLKEAVLILQQHLLKTTKVACSTSTEILPSQQPPVIGLQASNITLISRMTGALIHHPKADSYGATTFFIQGFLEEVLSARRFLIGCLPVTMMFEVSDSMMKIMDTKELEKQLDLHIGFRVRKNGETKQTIVIKGTERQISAIYSARQKIVDKDEPLVICEDYDFMQTFDKLSQIVKSVPGIFTPPPPALAALNPLVINSTITSPILTGLATPIITDSPLTPVFTYPCLHDTFSIVQQNLTSAVSCYGSFNGSLDSPNDLNLITSPSVNVSSSDQFAQIGNVNDVSPADLLIPTSMQQMPMLENTAVSVPNPFLADNTPDFNDAPIATGILETALKIQEQANNEWKAPGAGRVQKADYDRQKLLATKAMQEKAIGARTPNDHWSGLGFSRSMPAEQLRNRLNLMKLKSLSKNNAENNIGSNELNFLQEESDDDEDKIGPWVLDKKDKKSSNELNKKNLNSTNYFDFIRYPNTNKDYSYSEIDDLVTLLTKLQLTKYIDTFREQEIDTKTFLTMTDEDLKELGVNTFGARRKMLVAISEIKERKRNMNLI